MTGRKLLKVTGLSLVALIFAIVLFLCVFDFGVLKPKIESAVSDATRREFHIDGELSLKLLPTPTLLIEELSLASPDWGSKPNMLRLGKAYVKVNLLSLLSQPVVIEQFELADVNVLVETNEQQKLNWDLATSEEEKEEPEAEEETEIEESPIVIRAASIDKIQVIYRQPGAEDKKFTVDSVRVQKNDDAETQFNGNGQLTDIAFAFSGQVADHHTEFKADLGDVKISSKYDYPKDSVDFNIDLSTLSDLGGLIKVEDLPKEDLSLQGNIALSGGKILLKQVTAATSGIKLTVDGEIDSESASVQLSTQASGDKLSALSPDLPAIAFSLQSEIKVADKIIDAAPYTITFGDSKITGKAHVETGDVPVITVQAQSDLIDLSPFMADDSDAAKQPTSKEQEDKAEAKYVFDETPLPLDSLQTLNLAVDANIARLVMKNTQFKNIKLNANAKQGNITLKNTFEGDKGGKYDNNLSLKTSGKTADLNIKTSVRDYRLGMLAGENASEDEIPVTNLNVDLVSNGGSPRALASNLNGKLVVTQGEGRVSNELIEKFSGDIISQLFNALNPFSKQEQYTQWECSLFSLNFDSGFGDIDGFLLQTEKLMVVGGGKVDLNEEELDIEFNTKPRKGVGVSADMFVTPFVKLSGTLAHPSVGLNKKGALLSGGAAVLTGGMSFLYTGVMDRVTAEADRCEQAKEAIKNSGVNKSK